MKDIVIIANFCSALDKPSNSRFTYIADMLKEENNVEIIGSGFSHDLKKKRICDFTRFSYKITLVDEPGYKRNISIGRFLSHYVWGNRVYKYIMSRKKPDVVYCAIPSLNVAAKGGRYCNEHKIKFIIDVQDLWPEAFQMVLNVPILSTLLFYPFKRIANRAYGAADDIIGVSQTYVDRALSVNTKCKYGHSVFLGTNLKIFDQNVKDNFVMKPKDEVWLGYCGTLGASYDIKCVIDALHILRQKEQKVPKFVVMGDGYRKKEFEEYAKEIKVDAWFTGNLPYHEMCGLLSSCDIVVNPIMHGAAQSIINKHADYAASGLPVINTQESFEYQNLVSKYDMGFNCKNSDAEDIADKISLLINDEALRVKMGKNARQCAENKFDRERSYLDILKVISE